MTGPKITQPRAKRPQSPEAALASIMRLDSYYSKNCRRLAALFSTTPTQQQLAELTAMDFAVIRDALKYDEAGLD